MSNVHEQPDEQPTTEELEEPSTEKEPEEEPKVEQPHDQEPDHRAVGIGIVDGPQTEAAASDPMPESSKDLPAEETADQ